MFTAGRRRKRTGRGVEATGTDREAPPFYRPAHPPSRHELRWDAGIYPVDRELFWCGGGNEEGKSAITGSDEQECPSRGVKGSSIHTVINRSKFLLTERPGALDEVFYLLSSGIALGWAELQVCVSLLEDGIWVKSQSDQQLDCALDLMRRLPPQQIEKNLSDLIDLVPSLCEDLLSSVDQPLKIARDKVVGKDYLLCDYNRDGDSYRSPWSNKYDPPLEDGAMPSARLRKLEVEANNAFDQYRDLYFEGGVSSVYLWDLDHGFAGVILIKKAGDGSKKIKGCWDSIHVVEVQEKSSGRTAHYKLTSTVMLWLQTNKTGSGTMNLGGSLTRQMEKDETVSDSSPHIANIGRLVEDMENKIRSTLNEIYFGKTKDIVNGLRSIDAIPDNQKYKQLQRELSQVLTQRQIYIQPDN
ncbi:hypothetical protein DUI87_32008 [Hirundo rustica rustica]|uniref:F-actin-capping protein subunit beta n=240 Tax=Tetrapoda TaxID=32523 RepID=A0A3M0ITN1_HIRRU|nr:hypothetical protein DUI87_32008 [Hirundo rustica rustica]